MSRSRRSSTITGCSRGEMLDGLGMAETTPGPLIMVLQFVGFMAAFRDPGTLPPMLAGTLGGLLATWVTFTPCFLWIFLGAPFIEALRGNKALAGALSAITAAVVGVILNLADLVRAAHLCSAKRAPVRRLGLSFDAPVLGEHRSAGRWRCRPRLLVAIFRFKAGMLPTLLASRLRGRRAARRLRRRLMRRRSTPNDDPHRSCIMPARYALVIAVLAATTGSVRAETDWNKVAQALGKPGTEMPGGVYRVGLPWTDLHVTLDGVEIKPMLALGSWLAFRDGLLGYVQNLGVNIRIAPIAPASMTNPGRVRHRREPWPFVVAGLYRLCSPPRFRTVSW